MADQLSALTSTTTTDSLGAIPLSTSSTPTNSGLGAVIPTSTMAAGSESAFTATLSDSLGDSSLLTRISQTSSIFGIPASEVSSGLVLPATQTLLTSGIVSDTRPLSLATPSSTTGTTHQQTATAAPSATSSSSSSPASSSAPSLKIILPAVIIPVSIIAFVMFWWCMRKRYKKELTDEPDYLVFNGATKETIRSESSLSNTVATDRGKTYKMLPTPATREMTRLATPPERPTVSNDNLGNVRSTQPVNQNTFRQIDSDQEGLIGPSRRDLRSYTHFSSPRRNFSRNGPIEGPLPIDADQKSNRSPHQVGRVVSPASAGALDHDPNLRKPLPTPGIHAMSGSYDGGSPISQSSPVVREASVIDGMSRPVPRHHGITPSIPSQKRFAAGYLYDEEMSPALSPQLPPPATRSQLIPREFMKSNKPRPLDSTATANPADRPTDALLSPVSTVHPHRDADRSSLISAPDEYEDDDAKSEISSLNDVDRYEIESQEASRSQMALHSPVVTDANGLTVRGNTAGLDPSLATGGSSGAQGAIGSAYRW